MNEIEATFMSLFFGTIEEVNEQEQEFYIIWKSLWRDGPWFLPTFVQVSRSCYDFTLNSQVPLF